MYNFTKMTIMKGKDGQDGERRDSMKIDWKKWIIPTIVLGLLVGFYINIAASLLSRPDLSTRTKQLIMVLPLLLACVVIGLVMNWTGKE